MFERQGQLETRQTYQMKEKIGLWYFIIFWAITFCFHAPLVLIPGIIGRWNIKALNFHHDVLNFGIGNALKLLPYNSIQVRGEGAHLLRSKKPFVVVSNHRSHLDMFIFLAKIKRFRAAANSYIFRIPFLGQIMKLSQHFELKKGEAKLYDKNVIAMKEALKNNYKVLIFPEMTRANVDQLRFNRFRLTAFYLARSEDVEILPIVLNGTGRAWSKGEMLMNYNQDIIVEVLKPVRPSDFDSIGNLSRYVKDEMEQTFQKNLK